MKTRIHQTVGAALLALGLWAVPVRAAVMTYADGFTLTPDNLPYGKNYSQLPVNTPLEGTTALQWANTSRAGFAGQLHIADSGGTHGGVLQANNPQGGFSLNHATNVDLADTAAFTPQGGSELLWSVSFDLNRNVNTFNWFRLYMNYDPVTGTGLSVIFAMGNGTITIAQNGVESSSLANPGLVLGGGGAWGSFTFERYSNGTLRIVKTAGGGATGLDATVTLTNPDYTTGGTMAVSMLGHATTPNPLSVDNLELTVNVIPEPSAIGLLGMGGLGGLLWLRRRSKRRVV